MNVRVRWGAWQRAEAPLALFASLAWPLPTGSRFAFPSRYLGRFQVRFGRWIVPTRLCRGPYGFPEDSRSYPRAQTPVYNHSVVKTHMGILGRRWTLLLADLVVPDAGAADALVLAGEDDVETGLRVAHDTWRLLIERAVLSLPLVLAREVRVVLGGLRQHGGLLELGARLPPTYGARSFAFRSLLVTRSRVSRHLDLDASQEFKRGTRARVLWLSRTRSIVSSSPDTPVPTTLPQNQRESHMAASRWTLGAHETCARGKPRSGCRRRVPAPDKHRHVRVFPFFLVTRISLRVSFPL